MKTATSFCSAEFGEVGGNDRFIAAIGWMVEVVDWVPTGRGVVREVLRQFDEMLDQATSSPHSREEHAELTTARTELVVVAALLDLVREHKSKLRARLKRMADCANCAGLGAA